jgi:hypothetical protein
MGYWRTFFLSATDAPASYGEAAGLMALSSIALGQRSLSVGGGIRPNLFMLLTGDSSVARKSTAVRFAKQMVQEVRPQLVGPADFTMEGLFQWMLKKNEETGKCRTTLAIFAEEFGTNLAQSAAYGGTMREDMCRIYDGDDFEKVRASGANFTISNPRMNFFGGVAYPLLSRYCSKDDWFIGFFMRFMFVTPLQMREPQVIQPTFPRALWQHCVAEMLKIHDEIQQRGAELRLTPAADALYRQTITSLNTMEMTETEVAPVYMQRLGPNILKLALLYQIDEDPHADVSAASMKNAVDFASYCAWPGFQKAYKVTTVKEVGTHLDAVFAMARRPEGVAKPDVYRTFMSERGLASYLWSFVLSSGMFDADVNENGEQVFRSKR